ncbi:MAG: polynucleotide adenylyltransferase PcnB, partial [Undibacterium sp.]|nr:polynucleotide adenylyltransferase PcnB [Undibacterium sp.]
QVIEKWEAYKAAGELSIPALHLAADDVLNTQTDALALQRKIGSDMRDIWAMQPRFEKRTGKAPYKLLENTRLRAGYDFLLLRCASGEIETEIGDWWTSFIQGDETERVQLLAAKPKAKPPANNAVTGAVATEKKRRPRRSPNRKPKADE